MDIRTTDTMNKLIVENIATELKDGNIIFIDTKVKKYETLDEMGERIKKAIDQYIIHLKKECEGHVNTHATVIYPLIHVIHDDLNKGNAQYQLLLQSERN